MTAAVAERGARPRGKVQGTIQILRYNWPFYLAAAGASAAGIAAVRVLALQPAVRVLAIAGAAAALYWSAASLAASCWVYDLSPLCKWTWIAGWFPDPPRRFANLHAGLDESSPALLALFPGARPFLLDFFDPAAMTEPSIARARRLTPPAIPAQPVACDALPFPEAAWDAAFLVFAAHEIRDAGARRAFFRELARVIRPGGRLLVVEHLRDLANLLAFGPGAFHFLPRREWMRLAREGGFSVARERAFTPFVRALLLERSA
jgi:SAM-dependent methyltransferase